MKNYSVHIHMSYNMNIIQKCRMRCYINGKSISAKRCMSSYEPPVLLCTDDVDNDTRAAIQKINRGQDPNYIPGKSFAFFRPMYNGRIKIMRPIPENIGKILLKMCDQKPEEEEIRKKILDNLETHPPIFTYTGCDLFIYQAIEQLNRGEDFKLHPYFLLHALSHDVKIQRPIPDNVAKIILNLADKHGYTHALWTPELSLKLREKISSNSESTLNATNVVKSNVSPNAVASNEVASNEVTPNEVFSSGRIYRGMTDDNRYVRFKILNNTSCEYSIDDTLKEADTYDDIPMICKRLGSNTFQVRHEGWIYDNIDMVIIDPKTGNIEKIVTVKRKSFLYAFFLIASGMSMLYYKSDRNDLRRENYRLTSMIDERDYDHNRDLRGKDAQIKTLKSEIETTKNMANTWKDKYEATTKSHSNTNNTSIANNASTATNTSAATNNTSTGEHGILWNIYETIKQSTFLLKPIASLSINRKDDMDIQAEKW